MPPPPPPIGDFLAAVVPVNVVKAAAENTFLSLIIFTLVFAFALMRLAAEQRKLLVDFFTAIRDAMLVVIGWVLWIAPLGVFALALVVGARAGTGAFGALIHYILTVTAVGGVVSLLRLSDGGDRRAAGSRPIRSRGVADAGGGDQHAILARVAAGDAVGCRMRSACRWRRRASRCRWRSRSSARPGRR